MLFPSEHSQIILIYVYKTCYWPFQMVPYASVDLIVLSKILRVKVCDNVIPVYSELHNENMPFL